MSFTFGDSWLITFGIYHQNSQRAKIWHMLLSCTEESLKRQKIVSIFPSSIHLEEKAYLFLIKKKMSVQKHLAYITIALS